MHKFRDCGFFLVGVNPPRGTTYFTSHLDDRRIFGGFEIKFFYSGIFWLGKFWGGGLI